MNSAIDGRTCHRALSEACGQVGACSCSVFIVRSPQKTAHFEVGAMVKRKLLMSVLAGTMLWFNPGMCSAQNGAPIHKRLDCVEGQPNTTNSLVIPVDRCNFLREFLDGSKPYIVIAFLKPASTQDGGATAQADQLLEKMAAEFAPKRVKFIRVDVEKSPRITAKFRAPLHVAESTFVCISHKTKTERYGSSLRKELNEANLREFLDDALNDHLQWVKIGKQVPLPFRILMDLQERALQLQ